MVPKTILESSQASFKVGLEEKDSDKVTLHRLSLGRARRGTIHTCSPLRSMMTVSYACSKQQCNNQTTQGAAEKKQERVVACARPRRNRS